MTQTCGPNLFFKVWFSCVKMFYPIDSGLSSPCLTNRCAAALKVEDCLDFSASVHLSPYWSTLPHLGGLDERGITCKYDFK